MKKEYQALARRYRPQKFSEVLGQEAIVTTLKNGIAHERLSHAFLFCGSRGTGKTTLARILAKALNCENPSKDHEPCNVCSSCKNITSGHSLDILEIDGASHRGIDDIRQINDTVGYAASSGRYKIYIIDEVHMLTKEAFNALLKTLEEPPEKVKFFFATTEPHKVLPTILSRCQRFNLNRIPTETIIVKLKNIAEDLGIAAEEEALRMIANRAEGGLRDAESLLDQILSFNEGGVTRQIVADILGIMPRDVLFSLDTAGKEGNFAKAFEVAHALFSQGKDLLHFVESLTEHMRNILLVKLSGREASQLSLSEGELEQYAASAQLYRKEQCMALLDYLLEMQEKIRYMPSGRIALETILLHVLRSHNRLPVEYLVRRLAEMEKNATVAPMPREEPVLAKQVVQPPAPSIEKVERVEKIKKAEKIEVKKKVAPPAPPKAVTKEMQCQYDTLFQFAAVELEGAIQKHTKRS